MKATEFVKRYGWDLVKTNVACLESRFITKEDFLEHYGFEILDDLKSLVRSHKLVSVLGGLDEAKRENRNNSSRYSGRVKQAIADVEACQ